MKISMIAALGENRELGKSNKLIWKIPSDLARFRKLTSGHPIIMGRKTYESIGRLLPNRTNIIVSRDTDFKVEGAIVVSSIEQAIDKAKVEPGSNEIFIIGGAQIYNSAIQYADKLYLTKINAEDLAADAFFPDYSEFKKVFHREAREEDGMEYEFLDIER
ncbi:MAG: dihydrofolate reductase [Candidatus Levybacteria bacterium]|nr:dihydrofolate reductase [Candidatus Levybacteria bacterium]